MAHTSPESAVRGLVDIADIPRAGQGKHRIAECLLDPLHRGRQPAPRHAWQFLRHTLTPAMDKLTTTSGAIGCRRSTWNDPEVNAAIPFYHRIEQLHANAREIPQRADWPRIAAIIDKLVTANITTSRSRRRIAPERRRRWGRFARQI